MARRHIDRMVLSAALIAFTFLLPQARGQEPAEPAPVPIDGSAPEPADRRPSAQGDQKMQGMQNMGGTQGMQMTCCPPSAMSKMVDKPGGMAMMLVCGFLVAALLASVIAVLIALTIFLIRRSRVVPVAIR